MNEAILEIKDLSFTFPGYPGLDFPELFRDLNLKVEKGEIRVILGKPESGKTTLSRIITALIPRYSGGSLSGQVKLDGVEINGNQPYNLIQKAGTVFQNPDEQIITTRCDAEIAFPMESMGWGKKQIAERIDFGLESTGISHLRYRDPATLSGGEKRKLLLASLFAVNPPLWILDETFEELDPASLRAILKTILSQERTIIIFMTKPPAVLEEHNVKFSILYKGTLFHKEDSPENFKKLMIEEGLLLDPERYHSIQPYKKREPLLKIENLSYSYNTAGAFTLEIEHFKLNKGEIISIVGRNGSGKSTLGKILCGLLKPDSGQIFAYRESGLSPLDTKNLNALTGFIFQNPDYQIFLPTVKEELSYGLNPDEAAVDKIIELFSLPGKEVPPALMSYGARKRLQGAVYYLFEKDLYIVDEADSGLSVEDFASMITRFHQKGSTVLFITHNMELSRVFSERVYIMENGSVVQTADEDSFNLVNGYFAGKIEDQA
ncbi:MAG: hypothetical protein DRP59_01330 [Spirochaetes bacterium]|nr:MAG: hypothetical protein DRP59_01330 [Spirochaetota bacterium]